MNPEFPNQGKKQIRWRVNLLQLNRHFGDEVYICSFFAFDLSPSAHPRYRLRDSGFNREERDCSTEGQGNRQPRLDWCSDIACNAGYRG